MDQFNNTELNLTIEECRRCSGNSFNGSNSQSPEKFVYALLFLGFFGFLTVGMMFSNIFSSNRVHSEDLYNTYIATERTPMKAGANQTTADGNSKTVECFLVTNQAAEEAGPSSHSPEVTPQ
uniref:Potassium voltage-gated channel subfamily E member 1-like n=1 Tax=Geotrypetes seraphini TaxID=260995 RepID=A0A6P8R807_GEOSA|nr:potassium voltage-gated channel subfamily E member 1-like [Geotrypetes seraphini]